MKFKTFYNTSITAYITNQDIEPLKEGPWWKATFIRKAPAVAAVCQIISPAVENSVLFASLDLPTLVTLPAGCWELEFLDKDGNIVED